MTLNNKNSSSMTLQFKENSLKAFDDAVINDTDVQKANKKKTQVRGGGVEDEKKRQIYKNWKIKQNHPSHLNIADLWVVVSRPDLCDDGQRLEITGQTQATTGSWYLLGVIKWKKKKKTQVHSLICIYVFLSTFIL